jgi:hypothetical protein
VRRLIWFVLGLLVRRHERADDWRSNSESGLW